MRRFEYKVMSMNAKGLSGKIDEAKYQIELNVLGADGWELVSSELNSISGGVLAVFKREIDG